MDSNNLRSLRDRIGNVLRARWATALELLFLPLLLTLQTANVLTKTSTPLLLFGWLSMYLRRVGWRQIGLAWPAHWSRCLAAALVIALAYNAADIFVVIPFLNRITGTSLDLTQYDSLQGNLGTLAFLIAVLWPLAAFKEELAYRGYLLNRLADLFGKTPPAQALGVAVVSLVFGLAHMSQGLPGIIDNVLAGVLFGSLYLASGRNLWLPILVHGFLDTSSLILLYFGIHP